MKKSKLNLQELKETEELTRSQMKNVFGGWRDLGNSCICELHNGDYFTTGYVCPDHQVTTGECSTLCHEKYDGSEFIMYGASINPLFCND